MKDKPKVEHGKLLTEQRNPASMEIDARSVGEILSIINREDQKIAGIIAGEIPRIEQATNYVIDAFKQGGRLIYVGAGTSGRLGVLDASEIPPTYNASPELVQGFIAGGDIALRKAIEGAEDFPEDGARLVREIGVTPKDVVMGIATSGVTPYVLGSLEEARSIGAKTVFFTCVNPTDVSIDVDVLIAPQVGAEVITGSTRMKAGTATKLVLNMITTTAMIKMGKVFENLMVDLKATNNKLTDRARRIIASITDCSYEEAIDLLDQSNKFVKVALVMKEAGVGPDQAQEYLDRYAGNVREAISELEKE